MSLSEHNCEGYLNWAGMKLQTAMLNCRSRSLIFTELLVQVVAVHMGPPSPDLYPVISKPAKVPDGMLEEMVESDC